MADRIEGGQQPAVDLLLAWLSVFAIAEDGIQALAQDRFRFRHLAGADQFIRRTIFFVRPREEAEAELAGAAAIGSLADKPVIGTRGQTALLVILAQHLFEEFDVRGDEQMTERHGHRRIGHQAVVLRMFWIGGAVILVGVLHRGSHRGFRSSTRERRIVRR